MAGTRLIVHTTLFVELLVLIAVSFFYASNRSHDQYESSEPFVVDQSGWKILVEDVAAAVQHSPSSSLNNYRDIGSLEYVGEFASVILTKIKSLLGYNEQEYDALKARPRRVSAFVHEMRQKIEEFRFIGQDDNHYQESPSNHTTHASQRMALFIPQFDSSSSASTSIANALEKGFLRQSKQYHYVPSIKLSVANSTTDSRYDYTDMTTCDDFHLHDQSNVNINHREVKHPKIVILMGCTSVTIPHGQKGIVEVSRISGTILIRSKLMFTQIDELQSHLEEYISDEIVSNMLFSESSHGRRRGCRRLRSVSINLIDENPTSHISVEEGLVNSIAKSRFDMIGRALSSSVQLTTRPILEQLSFIYGGKIKVLGANNDMIIKSKGTIYLEAQASASYASLSGDAVTLDISDDQNQSELMTKFVSLNSLTEYAIAHSRQPVWDTNTDCRENIVWTLLVPSQDKFPLRVRAESKGDAGESIVLSLPESSIGSNNVSPNGLSIVNLPKFSESNEMDNSDLDCKISASLAYLVGYLRAIHGLPPYVQHLNGQAIQDLSFWELESIARSNYYSTLEVAFHETDALFALLRQHGSSLALPEKVAYELNNATHLLRQSISLVEQGYPMMYASSLLHGSLDHLEVVRLDHRLMELPFFAMDHYLAVFSPLVLPLLLPMISGLVRELKRFRTLRNKML